MCRPPEAEVFISHLRKRPTCKLRARAASHAVRREQLDGPAAAVHLHLHCVKRLAPRVAAHKRHVVLQKARVGGGSTECWHVGVPAASLCFATASDISR